MQWQDDPIKLKLRNEPVFSDSFIQVLSRCHGVGEVGLDQNSQGLMVTMEIKAFRSKDGFVNIWMDVAKSA